MRIENHPAYIGQVDREKAEDILDSKPKGSFVIRELDSLSKTLKHSLETENNTTVEACLITYKKEDKIGEYFIIHMEDKWWIYSDNPDLSKPKETSSSFEELVEKHKELSNSQNRA